MSIDKRLNPNTGGLVANLHDVCQHDVVVWLDEELDGGWEVVEFSANRLLRRGDCLLDADSGLGGCDGFC